MTTTSRVPVPRTLEEIAVRFPRLVAAMQQVALLSRSEAQAGIRDYLTGRDVPGFADLLRFGGGEAVVHFGGPSVVIQRGIRTRHVLSVRAIANAHLATRARRPAHVA